MRLRITFFAIAAVIFTSLSCSNHAGANKTDPKQEQQQECPPAVVDTAWQKEHASAGEIIETYLAVRQRIGNGCHSLHTKNLCNYIWSSGEYMFKCRGKNADIHELPKHLEDIALDDKHVEAFMIERDTARFADHYFTLKAMKQGSSFDESRDGITITVFYPPRSMNGNDYAKMKEVFSCKNSALHIAYMKKLKFPFRNSGCSEELYAIRPLIEQNVAGSKLKSEIIALFDEYKHLMPGSKAADARFLHTNGKECRLSGYKGKVIVIDVWATWCSSCLKGLKAYSELSSKYSGSDEIVFLTVSIDRSDKKSAVLALIEKKNLGSTVNLLTGCPAESPFETAYKISGIPRCIVIDKSGNIISAYAPPAGGGLEEIIAKLLK